MTSDTSGQDNALYSARFIRFVRVPWHTTEYRTAYLAPDARSSRVLLERLHREFVTLPPRHDCSCRCPNELRGFPACTECKRLRLGAVQNDAAAEQGRTSPVSAPMPSVLVLDLQRATSVLGRDASASRIARFLSRSESEMHQQNGSMR